MTQHVQISAILIAAANGKDPGSDHGRIVVDGPAGITFIMQTGSDHIGKAKLPFDLTQQQNAAVRGQRSAIKTGFKRMAINR